MARATYYHFPAMHSPRLSMVAFLRGAAERIPTFAGIKFTDENLMEFAACLDAAEGRQGLFFGRDEILLSALVLGARGAVGSTYNLIAPLFNRVVAAFAAGDSETARREQAHIRRLIEVLSAFGGLPTGKVAMQMQGIDCGPVRLPLRSLSPERYAAFRAQWEAVGAVFA